LNSSSDEPAAGSGCCCAAACGWLEVVGTLLARRGCSVPVAAERHRSLHLAAACVADWPAGMD